MDTLKDRIIIVTGAGNGIGKEHALLMASEGAKVVVNDLGGSVGGGGSSNIAAEVVAEIEAAGGTAIANTDDIATTPGAERLIRQAVDAFGGLDVLINNAGILRDRSIVKLSDDDWDSVIRVHLRGHFCPLRAAAQYWKDEAAAGRTRKAAVVNTSSTSGLKGNFGQSNYGAAKAGIGALTIIADLELYKSGVRVNAIAPGARTRMTENLFPNMQATEGTFDDHSPANISPLVAYLSTENATEHGRVYFVSGGRVCLFQPWHIKAQIKKEGRWTVEELTKEMRTLDLELIPSLQIS